MPVTTGNSYTYRLEFRQSDKSYIIQSPLMQAPSGCRSTSNSNGSTQILAPSQTALSDIAQCNDISPRVVLKGGAITEGADSYRLERNGAFIQAFSAKTPDSTKSTGYRILTIANTYTDTNIASNITYDYVLESIGSGGVTSSQTLRITPTQCKGKPAAFTVTGGTTCVSSQAKKLT